MSGCARPTVSPWSRCTVRGKTLRQGDDIRNLPLKAGDTLVVHTTWDRLAGSNPTPISSSSPPNTRTRKCALTRLACPVVLSGRIVSGAVFQSSPVVSLLTGALGMVLSGVLSMEEAYKAVSWKTVFLLASLIPLGWRWRLPAPRPGLPSRRWHCWAMSRPGCCRRAGRLATFFTLVMSNVGATVLLVPLAVNLAVKAGADPAVFALTVAISTSNSFLIPTHQVNALLMGPGGYRVPDFMRAGGIMTVLFLIVMMIMMNLIF